MLRLALRYVLLALFVGVALALLCYLFVWYCTRDYILSSADALPSAQAALVLGASVTTKGVLSPVLQERADTAVALYVEKKVSKILVTGDNSSVLHDEVDPVGKYLVAAGVPKEDVFLDHAGFDTYSSMYRTRDVFGAESVIIVSQPFHLARAVFIARALGLSAWGAPAGTKSEKLYAYNYAREIPATLKAVFDLLFRRVPKYLGPQFKIEGDGSATWSSGV